MKRVLTKEQKNKLSKNFKKLKKWNYHNEWKKGVAKSDEAKKKISEGTTGVKKVGDFSTWKIGRKGERANRFIDGRRTYIKILSANRKKWCCEKCGIGENLNVHHIDKNRKNNSISNLMLVCFNCHLLEHGGKFNDKFYGNQHTRKES